MSFDDTKKIVDKFASELSELAYEFDLTFYRNKKPTPDEHWSNLVELNNKKKASYIPRQSFTVSLNNENGSIYVWHSTPNGGGTGKDVEIGKLDTTITKALKDFKKFLKDVASTDLKETAKKDMGTKYLWEWEYESSSEEGNWTCELKDRDLFANLQNFGRDDTWYVNLASLKNDDISLEAHEVQKKAKDIIKKLEKLLDMDIEKLKKMTDAEFEKAVS
jgi:hypothetical protein